MSQYLRVYSVYTDVNILTQHKNHDKDYRQMTDPPSRQRGRPPRGQRQQWPLCKTKNLVMSPRRGSTPRLTD
jgi:hypothetical protein